MRTVQYTVKSWMRQEAWTNGQMMREVRSKRTLRQPITLRGLSTDIGGIPMNYLVAKFPATILLLLLLPTTPTTTLLYPKTLKTHPKLPLRHGKDPQRRFLERIPSKESWRRWRRQRPSRRRIPNRRRRNPKNPVERMRVPRPRRRRNRYSFKN